MAPVSRRSFLAWLIAAPIIATLTPKVSAVDPDALLDEYGRAWVLDDPPARVWLYDGEKWRPMRVSQSTIQLHG
jgi:hypothetical protein